MDLSDIMLASMHDIGRPDHTRLPMSGAIRLALVLRVAGFHNMRYEDMDVVTNVEANSSLLYSFTQS